MFSELHNVYLRAGRSKEQGKFATKEEGRRVWQAQTVGPDGWSDLQLSVSNVLGVMRSMCNVLGVMRCWRRASLAVVLADA